MAPAQAVANPVAVVAVPVKAPALARNLLCVLFVASYFRYYRIEEFATWANLSYYGANYVLDGLLDVVQSVVFCVLFWRVSWLLGMIATPMCITVIVEGLQTSVCRLAVMDVSKVPSGMNLCEYVTGIPAGQILVGFVLVGTMLTYGYAQQQRSHHPDSDGGRGLLP